MDKIHIEQWIHEVKTPIAAAYLLIENGESSSIIEEELIKIEDYIQQALYFVKSKSPEKDFVIHKFDLANVVDYVLKQHASSFISKNIRLEYVVSNVDVLADFKWIAFVLSQLLSNSIKYLDGEDKRITIMTEIEKDHVLLEIIDNGIGIPAKDLPRVFDKGFTGENGRGNVRSTGLGLYICKNLCDKLFVDLNISSDGKSSTKASLTFRT